MLDLARQAGLKKDHGNDREYIGNFDWREFGKLIVQECLNNMKNCDGDLDYAIWKIRNDFGVE